MGAARPGSVPRIGPGRTRPALTPHSARQARGRRARGRRRLPGRSRPARPGAPGPQGAPGPGLGRCGHRPGQHGPTAGRSTPAHQGAGSGRGSVLAERETAGGALQGGRPRRGCARAGSPVLMASGSCADPSPRAGRPGASPPPHAAQCCLAGPAGPPGPPAIRLSAASGRSARGLGSDQPTRQADDQDRGLCARALPFGPPPCFNSGSSQLTRFCHCFRPLLNLCFGPQMVCALGRFPGPTVNAPDTGDLAELSLGERQPDWDLLRLSAGRRSGHHCVDDPLMRHLSKSTD